MAQAIHSKSKNEGINAVRILDLDGREVLLCRYDEDTADKT